MYLPRIKISATWRNGKAHLLSAYIATYSLDKSDIYHEDLTVKQWIPQASMTSLILPSNTHKGLILQSLADQHTFPS